MPHEDTTIKQEEQFNSILAEINFDVLSALRKDSLYDNLRVKMSYHYNRPLIVGINYTSHPNTSNLHGSDHFVVIIGRGSDSNGCYFTYMETGTDHQYQGYDPKGNRLYYNPTTKVLRDEVTSLKAPYTVTNVRPNDGNKYNTTAVTNLN